MGQSAQKIKQPQQNPEGRKIRILVVEDDCAILESMQTFLTIAGFDAHKSESAENALKFIHHTPVDVLITDIILPGMSGLELTERVKKKFEMDVIVMTGFSGDYSYEEAVRMGASDFVFKPIRFEELLLRINRVLKERHLESERAKMLYKLNTLAITDDLTQLYNSRHFNTQIKAEVDRATRYFHSLALLLFDIDFFKKYNDTYGHLAGDKVLATIGRLVRNCLRTMDSAYRYGGEEFTVILPETTGTEAQHVAERIRSCIEDEPFSPVPGKEVTVTVSLGITEYQSGESPEDLIRRSDEAMYQSKRKGRNRITLLLPQDS